MSELDWKQQKLCSDVGDYQLIVEQQKRDWQCDQSTESWKWTVVYHGSVVSSGNVNDMEEAKQKAEANVPDSAHVTNNNE